MCESSKLFWKFLSVWSTGTPTCMKRVWWKSAVHFHVQKKKKENRSCAGCAQSNVLTVCAPWWLKSSCVELLLWRPTGLLCFVALTILFSRHLCCAFAGQHHWWIRSSHHSGRHDITGQHLQFSFGGSHNRRCAWRDCHFMSHFGGHLPSEN